MTSRGTTYEEAAKLGDQAMDVVERKAEVGVPGFGLEAADFIQSFLMMHGPTSSEDLNEACCESGIEPHDDRAFGPVYRRLIRLDLIYRVGGCSRRRGHGTSGGNIWAAKEVTI